MATSSKGGFVTEMGSRSQQKSGEIACPECGQTAVEKAMMAPHLGRSRETPPPISPARFRAALLEMQRQVESHCDYVGNRFAEEARRIHYGEIDPHSIYGEASEEESRELTDEGISFGRVPWVPHTDS